MYINREALENQGVEIHVTDESIRFEFPRGRDLDTRSISEQLHEAGLPTMQVEALTNALHNDANNQMILAAINRSHAFVPPNRAKKARR